MSTNAKSPQLRSAGRTAAILATALVMCSSLTGCFVAGYSSGGGWFIWPGSIGLLLVVLLVALVMRR